jgi:hypothetical protein
MDFVGIRYQLFRGSPWAPMPALIERRLTPDYTPLPFLDPDSMLA